MAAAASGTQRLPWSYLRMMGLSAAGFTSFAVTLSALPAWAASRGLSTTAAGATTTVTLAATVACQPLVPALLRRLSTPVVTAVGLLFLGLPSAALPVTGTGAGLYAVCVVRGVGFALLTVAGAILITEVARPQEQGRVTGLYGLSASVPQLVFIPLSVWLLQHVGFEPIVAIAVGVPLLGAVLGWIEGPGVDRGDEPAVAVAVAPGAPPDVRQALAASWAPAAVLGALTIMGGAFVTIVPIRFPSGSTATLALLLYGVAGALARWGAGALADRAGVSRPLALNCAAGMLGLVLFAPGLSGPTLALILAGSVLIGAAFGAGQSLTLVAAFARSSVANRPATSTIWNVAFDLGTAVGAVLIGLLVAGPLGLAGSFAVLALLIAAVLPAALMSGREGPSDAP